jgi:hypothetical protein
MGKVSEAVAGIVDPQFGTVDTWCKLSGQTRTKAYEALAAGHLKAVKNGRTTLIDIQAGFAWLRTLPAATFGDKRAA